MRLKKATAVLLALTTTLGANAAFTVNASEAATENVTEAAEEYGTVTIENGDRTVTFTEMPKAVLCANLYSAENMVMLGIGDKVIAKNVTTNPAEVPLPEFEADFEHIQELEKNNENAVASGADLLIGQVSAFQDTAWGTYEQLENEGINCLTITGTIVADETVEDIYTDIRNLGKIFKVEEKAEEVIADMQAQFTETSDVVKDVAEEDKPSVFVYDMFKEDQIYTTSSGLESNLIEMAGGINTTKGMADSRWFMTGVETLVAANPDIIIINDYGSQSVEEKMNQIKSNPACSDIPAVQNDRFLVIPLVEVMQDIRAVNACRTMAQYFYPDLFA